MKIRHGVSTAADSAKPASRDEWPWLVMVYMAGDNCLTEEMVLSLQDIMQSGAPHGGIVVAQLDPGGTGIATQRYNFSAPPPVPRSSRSALLPPHLEYYRDRTFDGLEGNTGSRESLMEFVRWAWKQKAGRRMRSLLILSGHGSGTTEDFFLKDETSADSLTFEELAEAFIGLRGDEDPIAIDVLGLDACYMCMGELAYELCEHVGILIGPEGLEPSFGWPYRRILSGAKLHKGPMDDEQLARLIVHEYVEHYADYDRAAGRSADMAALRLKKMDSVTRAFAALVDALPRSKAGHERVLLAHWYAQTYKADQFVDLKDLCDQLRKVFPRRGRVGKASDTVIEAIRSCVIYSRCSGFSTQFSHGVSIYFPWATVSPDYWPRRFPKHTGWASYLKDHLKATQRKPRRSELLPKTTPVTQLLERAGLNEKTAESKGKTIRHGIATRLSARLGVMPDAEPSPAAMAEEAIVRRLRCLLDMADTPGQLRALLRTAKRVDAGNIPAVDIPNALARRFFRSRYTERGKHTERSKYADRLRSTADRESWVKNLPPVVGISEWP